MKNEAGCLFCRMIRGEIPIQPVYQDNDFVCIRDIQPQAPTHLLLIPKTHIRTLAEAFSGKGSPEQVLVVEKLYKTAVRIAEEQGLLPNGFRAVINIEKMGGQSVFHLHMHLLGGAQLNGSFG